MLQLESPDGLRIAKIGDRVLSWHATKPYPGWAKFGPELLDVLKFLFGRVEGFKADRLGFRYINLVNEEEHAISGVEALNLHVAIGEKPLHPPLNINYQRTRSAAHEVVTRIASPQFVTGPKTPFTALMDIDVFTPDGFVAAKLENAVDWVIEAHDVLKREFFPLLRPDTLKKLTEHA
jgi:uncharacterized protein (TIGR04255 family)